jgi:energy-coupling factor transporter ATP-binding protein EcfA2
MIYLKHINISGFRGIRTSISIPLNSDQSLLIYGDNGSGKSSITDAVEWFYYDRVEHLSKEEIGRKGLEALRNKFLPDEDSSSVSFGFSDDTLNAKKSLSIKSNKLTSSISNTEIAFPSYINDSQKENLLLRYRDLVAFIYQSKSEKLKSLSQIIGYGDVVSTRGILLTARNKIASEIKASNFDNKISQSQAQLLQQVNQPIHDDSQYYAAIQKLIEPLGLSIKISDDKSIETVLKKIKQPENKDDILLQESYEKSITLIANIITTLESIPEVYSVFYSKHQSISKNIEDLKKLRLEKILSEGYSLIDEALYDEDKCPLCLQDKDRNELLDELKARMAELSELKKEKEELAGLQQDVLNLIKHALSDIKSLKSEKCFLIKENTKSLELITQLHDAISIASQEIKGDVLGKTVNKELINVDIPTVTKLSTDFTDKKKQISEQKKDDKKFDINSKITLARQIYKGIVALRVQSEILKAQYRTLEALYKDFVKRQKKGFVAFLDAISKEINELYLFMNIDEKVDEIKLVPLGSGDDFDGITFHFKFHGEIVTPPDKYLSESHLNCLGICLFLSSVKAFNTRNKFIVLDDVISSFDKNHRVRFARLLVEKFADYQILLFTHEKDWFDYIANMVKGKGWKIHKIKWNVNQGASIEIPLTDLKSRIEFKLQQQDTDELGNLIRKYLEKLLKEVCHSLGVRVKFQFNDKNEDRMPDELLSELRSHIKKKKSQLKDNPVFDSLNASTFLGNKASHDSKFQESIPDLQAFYDDVHALESLFKCVECNKMIAIQHFDTVNKKICCSCGKTSYDWK